MKKNKLFRGLMVLMLFLSVKSFSQVGVSEGYNWREDPYEVERTKQTQRLRQENTAYRDAYDKALRMALRNSRNTSSSNTESSNYGKISYKGGIYTGELRYGIPYGKGTLILENSRYIGDFRDGDYNGYGIFISTRGHRYEGDFLGGLPDGQQTVIYPDGSVYVGQFRNGLNNGYGRVTMPDGEVITGEFKDGKFPY